MASLLTSSDVQLGMAYYIHREPEDKAREIIKDKWSLEYVLCIIVWISMVCISTNAIIFSTEWFMRKVLSSSIKSYIIMTIQ